EHRETGRPRGGRRHLRVGIGVGPRSRGHHLLLLLVAMTVTVAMTVAVTVTVLDGHILRRGPLLDGGGRRRCWCGRVRAPL
ncbi:hypothetical protein LSTR_LSTR014808, partial [Laodelphax striatellus]